MKFYSEKLNKLFETEKELVIAEKEAAEADQKKTEAAKAKKADAAVVEASFKARNAARVEYNTKVMAARKAYNESIAAAKKAFDEAVADATKAKDAAEEKYDKALKEFTAKHDTYHMTLKDGDNVVTISNANDKSFEHLNRDFNGLIDTILKIWNL
jgi:phage-related protein